MDEEAELTEFVKTIFSYDPDTGVVVRIRTGVPVETTHYDRLVAHFNYKKEKTEVPLPRIALMLSGVTLKPDDLVIHKDGNSRNMKLSNLVVVDRRNYRPEKDENPIKYIPTETAGVFVGLHNEMYIVRRGPKQSVYRTPFYEEAVKVRKDWEANPSLVVWDHTMPLQYR